MAKKTDTQKQTLSYYKGRVNDIIKQNNLLAERLKDANTTHKMALKRLGAFSESDYRPIAQWQDDILRFIKSQNAILDIYKREVSEGNHPIDKP